MTVDSGRAAPFESISELKEAHSHLLGALDSELQADTSPEAETTAIVRHEADAHSFIERCAATGVFLENLGDRTAATVLMDYWTSTLVRAGRPTTSLRLLRSNSPVPWTTMAACQSGNWLSCK